MKKKKITVAIFFYVTLVSSSQAPADEIATTADGRRVTLHEDGTYTATAEIEVNESVHISFTDFLIDSESLVGKGVIVLGTGGFRNDRNEVRPRGSVYQKTFTIGPSISIDSSALDRANLVKVHGCPLQCYMEISGVVKQSTYGTQYIEAKSIRLLESYEFIQLISR